MRSAVAAVALALLAAAGCAGPSSARPSSAGPSSAGPSGGGPQVDRLGPVTVRRTGGIAGVQDEVIVQPDGTWGRAGSGAATRGRLPADRNATLTRMAADPALRTEATRTTPAGTCADAFEYTVLVLDIRVMWTDCDALTPPVASRIARFVLAGANSR
jgi:hypothetical protein